MAANILLIIYTCQSMYNVHLYSVQDHCAKILYNVYT